MHVGDRRARCSTARTAAAAERCRTRRQSQPPTSDDSQRASQTELIAAPDRFELRYLLRSHRDRGELRRVLGLALASGGGDVNTIDKNGETALHGAIYRGGNVAAIQSSPTTAPRSTSSTAKAGRRSSSPTASSTRPTCSSATPRPPRCCASCSPRAAYPCRLRRNQTASAGWLSGSCDRPRCAATTRDSARDSRPANTPRDRSTPARPARPAGSRPTAASMP